MSETPDLPKPDEVTAELVTQLLECGAVLSQMISQMVQFEAAAGTNPDAVPIPEMAHRLVGGVLIDLRRRYSRRDRKIAAAIISEATEAISEDIFYIPLEELEDSGIDGDAGRPGE